jgi:hypothetical protein
MDELKMLGTTLAGPDPSPDIVDRSRHRLQNVMRVGPAKPRRRKRWVVAGVGLTAAAAATAVVLSGLSTPDPKKGPVLSGQQVMLAAATAAESKPESSGTYWHTKLVLSMGKETTVTETWIRRDGRTWLSGAPGLVSRVKPRPMIEFTKLDYAHIQRLPTDPDRLKAALLKSSELPKDGDGDQRQLNTVNLLQMVLAEAPAPPKVRAAAYRALAALPNIANLGRTKGGYRLKISYMNSTGKRVDGTETIVVDPKTTQLRVEGWAGFGDGGLPVGPSQRTSGWTDRLPGRIVPWSDQIPYIQEENERANGNHCPC